MGGRGARRRDRVAGDSFGYLVRFEATCRVSCGRAR